MRSILTALCLLWASSGAHAHGIRHETSRSECVVVTLTHDDGEPFADQRYDLYRPGEAERYQSGRTDGDGRVVFFPGTGGDWRLRAFSEDGHGVDMTVAVAMTATPAPSTPAPDTITVDAATARTPCNSRTQRIVTGVSLLFGFFGVVMLFTRRK